MTFLHSRDVEEVASAMNVRSVCDGGFHCQTRAEMKKVRRSDLRMKVEMEGGVVCQSRWKQGRRLCLENGFQVLQSGVRIVGTSDKSRCPLGREVRGIACC